MVSSIQVRKTGYAYLVDERHFLIAQREEKPGTERLQDLSKRPFIQQLLLKNGGSETAYLGLKGVEVLGRSARIESVNWHVVVELPLAEAYAPVRRMLLFMLGALCLSAFAALGLGLLLSRRFVNPLSALTAASKHIESGDFSVRVRIADRHELGTLAAAFNTMTTKLEELIAGLKRNVAELERKGAELQKSEARFRALFEQAAVGVAQVITETGRFVHINQKYCAIVGYSQTEMMRLTIYQLIHPDDLQFDLDNMTRLKNGEIREFSMDKRYFHKSGRILWVNLTVSPMWRTGETPDFHIAIVTDITLRKQARLSVSSLPYMARK